MTSLHPPSFHRNDFSTCSTHFSFGAKPQQKCVARARVYALRTRMRTRTTPPRPLLTCTRACYGVVQCLPMKSPTIYRRNLRSLGVRAHLHRLWRGLVKKSAPRLVLVRRRFTEEDDNDDEYDDTKIEKLHMSGFSRGKPEAGRLMYS